MPTLSPTAWQLFAVNGLETAYEIAVSRFKAHSVTGRPAQHHKDDAAALAEAIDIADEIAASLRAYHIERNCRWSGAMDRMERAFSEPLNRQAVTILCESNDYNTPAELFDIATRAVAAQLR